MNAINAIMIANRWSALFFGVLLNLFTPANENLTLYFVKTVVGTATWLAFQLLANYLIKRMNQQDKSKEEEK